MESPSDLRRQSVSHGSIGIGGKVSPPAKRAKLEDFDSILRRSKSQDSGGEGMDDDGGEGYKAVKRINDW